MGEIVCQTDGSVMTITLSNLRARNGMTRSMNEELVHACACVTADTVVGAVVIKGANGTFCSGTDRRDWDSIGQRSADEVNFERLSLVYEAFMAVGHLPVPTVAAVRGAAVGGGLNLALATDLRVVADNARLIGGFVRNQLHPGGGFFTLLERAGGREVAAALGLFDEEIRGSDAVCRGLAYEAVPDEQVEARAMEIARNAARDPELTRMVTKSFREQLSFRGVPWVVAAESDKSRQIWSHARRAKRLRKD